MSLSFEQQNAFNLGASGRANNGVLKNPFSRKTELKLHDAWHAGWNA